MGSKDWSDYVCSCVRAGSISTYVEARYFLYFQVQDKIGDEQKAAFIS
jgi:hypothetical protein